MVFDSSGGAGPDDRPCPVSRRVFLGTAAAGALGAAGETVAGQQDRVGATATEELAWIAERVGRRERVPTLIEVDQERDLEDIETVGTETRVTREPRPAAYAQLTAGEITELDGRAGVERLRFAPGANPFWKLGDYDDGAFPDPTDAADYIAYEEALAAIDALSAEHPDRLATRTIGQTVGLENQFEGRQKRQDIELLELTTDVTDREAVTEKAAVVYSIGIHGDERAGVESGLRFIDRLLAGEEPEIAALLDDIVLVFVLSNPDGWRSRVPQTENVESPGDDVFMRYTGGNVDPNRQYPTAGLVDPGNTPAEPYGTNLEDDQQGLDDDVSRESRERVAGELAIVDALREYDTVGFAADYHGMYGSEYLVKGLLMNNQYGVREQGQMDQFNEALGDRMASTAGELFEDNREAIREAADARARFGGGPSELYAYGTVYDTIGYNVSGSMGSWLGDAMDLGGLGGTAITFEMALDNCSFGVELEYRPDLLAVQTAAYDATFRELAVATATDRADAVDANGRDAAYVESDTLTRTDEQLSVDENTAVKRTTRTVSAGERLSIPVGDRVQTLSIRVTPTPSAGTPGRARLDDPTGQTVHEDAIRRGEFGEHADWLLGNVHTGDWQLSLTGDRDGAATVSLTAVVAQDTPDPRDVLGFEQRAYEVTPLAYFEDYDEALAGASVDDLSVETIAEGALLDAGDPVVDQLVVIHADGLDDQAYLDAIDAYLDAGGELVLTDAGVSLLGALDAGGATGIDSRDVRETDLRFATLDEKRADELLDGVREIQSELWTTPTLGYTASSAPATVVDSRAFERAGGSVAATAARDVIAGRLDSITIIGSVLPPASQNNLHPFGLNDYAPTGLGQQLLRNALGHEQPGDAEDSPL
jgi:hypothetical protein